MVVAQKQLEIERNLTNGTPMRMSSSAISSRYLSSSYSLINGVIVIESVDDDLLVIFEPLRIGPNIEWKCVGRPNKLFDKNYPFGIADCGRRFRDVLVSGGYLNDLQK